MWGNSVEDDTVGCDAVDSDSLMNHTLDGVSNGAVLPVSVLVGVYCHINCLFNACHYQPLKACHDYWGECSWVVIIKV